MQERCGCFAYAPQFASPYLRLRALLPLLEAKPLQFIQVPSSMKLLGTPSLALHPRTIRSGPDGGRVARTQPPASAMIPLSGRLPSRRACARNLVGSDLARGRNLPSLKL